MTTNPQQQRQQEAENSASKKPEDRIRFVLIPGHPPLDLGMMDPFAEAIEEMAARDPDRKSVGWDEFDAEVGINVNYVPAIQVNNEIYELTPEKLQWLVAMGAAVLKGVDGGTPALEKEMEKFRRHMRGETVKK
jgi:hypothetical protein